MNAEELRKRIGKRTYVPDMDGTDTTIFDFLMWHEKLVGYRTDRYQWQLLQALDDEELMARYARFIFEQGD